MSRNALLPIGPGDVLNGKFEVLRRLAVGGMAEIFLARVRGEAGFEKVVVLKRILSAVARDPTFVGMFLAEARLAATLSHPNIANVYDVGFADGTPFMTMEFVHGQDARMMRLAKAHSSETLPLAIALAIVHGTASALDYVHEKTDPQGRPLGLVHRDISAGNVIVSYDGAVKLLDFGIARATHQTQYTQTGTLKGKAPYMSPEQCRGERVDRRSDLYSLGVVMFELTVGRRPFRGDSDFDIMDQIVHHHAPRPSAFVAGYPDELEAIVMRLLAYDPAARYHSAEELLRDLDAFIARHRLWVSSNALGKYMRALFAEKIAAWERTAHDPRSFDVDTSVTGDGHERVTPSAAQAALLPISPMSQQRDTVAKLEHSGRQRISDLAIAVPPLKTPRSQAIASPPSSRRTYAFMIAGAFVGAAAIAGFYAWESLHTRGVAAASPARSPRVAEPAAGGLVEVTAPTDPARTAPAMATTKPSPSTPATQSSSAPLLRPAASSTSPSGPPTSTPPSNNEARTTKPPPKPPS